LCCLTEYCSSGAEDAQLPKQPKRNRWAVNIVDILQARRDEILQIAAQHGARNVRVFGSVARGAADAQSDVDLLVDLEPGRSLLDHAALMLELEALLHRKVDIATERGLRQRIRDRVLAEARSL
jgi:hypothetical protein